ncbi:MAG TPA: rhodanese-like domain-containing protein [Byssovorax sp.]|jgi:rhodanese-related sulfurtransferase
MPDFKRVSPSEAKDLLDAGYTYVDVRTEAEYAAGHPKGALNVPIATSGPRGMEPNPRFAEVVEKLFAKDAKLVVGCKAGGRSLRAAEALTGAGFTSVVDQRAGWDGARDAFGQLVEPGWSPAGLPSETTTAGADYASLLAKIGA